MDSGKDERFAEARAKLGGKARAEKLSDEEKSAIGKKGAAARWGVRATHRGNFKKEFGIDVDCYVLDDDQKTAVISRRGIATAIGFDQTSGTRLTGFLEGRKIAAYVGREIADKLQKPLVFQWGGSGREMPKGPVHGYDVTLLIDICKAIIQAHAEGALEARQERIARQAQIVVNASAKAGIKGLVYALAGYDATREEIVKAFKLYVHQEAREYEKEFPDQLYEEWYRLYQLPKPQRGKAWKFRHLTVGHVWTPLAHSNGKILQLARVQKAAGEDRWAKLHQFLSEIGVKALRTHLGQLLGIAQVSDTQAEYERHVEKVFGRQLKLPNVPNA